ncbi:L-lactate permease [Bacteroides sp.]|uniref:L-lactate permease n=1 Tax=Bacteroides sp. TaxID=29523 RepID=UPI001B654214|nr:L-lactate permease [Bacteroides sp.]MBP6065572.1 L-lactate permease [Bacteroides sp.]MBP6067811.1 L-lactate permease [Bacteroides sp.]MBP6936296.1 L-lactate permease [Bacteroides sp.]MBP8621604.1 L-lactate permease [Bacteroides sp.]MBP9506865.1 L-lactate permease [Bacteroides sp.]
MSLILAVFPVLLLIVLMTLLKMSGDKSSAIALVATMLIAVLGFSFSASNLLYSFLYGALKAISPILIIILMAIFSYNVLLKTAKMEIIKQQFSSISTDKSIQVLLLTWGFGGLLEAMAGFGTAVAIPAAILISLGFKPIFSAVVSLIANSVATAFGAIGTPVLVLAKETGLDVLQLSTTVVLQLSVLMFLIPFVLLVLTDHKLKSLPKNLTLAILVGGFSFGGQYLAARYMGPESPAIIGSIVSIIIIVAFGKLTASKADKHQSSPLKTKEILNAWSIYLLILLLIVLTSPLFPQLRTVLAHNGVTQITFPINNIFVDYKISWLTHAGVLLFIGTFIGGLIQGASVQELFAVLWSTLKQLKKTVVTVICLVSLSTIMDFSGMIAIIATVLAAATGGLYPLFAPAIGCLGTFITGSDTSSNILFGKLQATVAGQIGVNPDWLAAANTVGATGGKIISPQSIAIATSASNQQGKEGEILKAAMPYSLVYILIAGIIVFFFS